MQLSANAGRNVFSTAVGYQNVEVPADGWSLFTATFKNISSENFDLNTLVPMTPNGDVIQGDVKIQIYVLDDQGNYGDIISWYGSKGENGIWSKDEGESKIADGEVTIGNGKGFAVYNMLKMRNGVEDTTRFATPSPAAIRISGEVDLTCRNRAIPEWSVNGNSTPVAIDLNNIIPQTPAGITVSGDAKIQLYLLDDEGNYGDIIAWYGTKGYWSQDDGETKIGVTMLNAGSGFAIYNMLKTRNGVEDTTRFAAASDVYLQLPSPLAK